ncbi:MAG: hypothetical protein RL621_2059 [Bacteroidota bacterium]|jgi:uncharacterized membrane protein YfcA|nr:sulfite exporter TauE/SafE family protein [Betaproteobacteria bacterium]
MEIFLLIGLFLGIVMGLTGAGGGILSVPLIISFTQLTIAEAAPVGLMTILSASSISAILGLKHGHVRYRAAILMSIFGIIFSAMGLWVAHHTSNNILSILFSIVLLWSAFNTLRSKGDLNQKGTMTCDQNPNNKRFIWTKKCSLFMMLSGSLAGFLSGMLGVGGGFIIVPALRKLSSLSHQSIIATSLTTISIISLFIVLTSNLALQNINWNIALSCLIGSIAGIVVAKSIHNKLNTDMFNKIFAFLLIAVALLLISRSH